MPLGSGIDPEHQLGTPQHAARVTQGRHPGTQSALAWLCFSHLPENLQRFSQPFYEAAMDVIQEITDSAELTTALNKLIEAKDSAMRAGIRSDTGRAGPVPRPQMIVDPPVQRLGLPHHPDFGTGKATAQGPGSVANTGVINNTSVIGRPIRDNPQA